MTDETDGNVFLSCLSVCSSHLVEALPRTCWRIFFPSNLDYRLTEGWRIKFIVASQLADITQQCTIKFHESVKWKKLQSITVYIKKVRFWHHHEKACSAHTQEGCTETKSEKLPSTRACLAGSFFPSVQGQKLPLCLQYLRFTFLHTDIVGSGVQSCSPMAGTLRWLRCVSFKQ